jgi:hypothetical protein
MPFLPTWDVRIAWEATPIGAFTIGASSVGSTSYIESATGFDFSGTYDNLTSKVQALAYQRGKNSLLTGSQPGTASITILDPTGIYDPQNGSSPLAGSLVPMRPVYIKADSGKVFTGFLRSITHDKRNLREAYTTFECFDLLQVLAKAKPTIPSGLATTTGGALALLHANSGLSAFSAADFDTGDTFPAFSTDGTKDALNVSSELLQAALGRFFADGNGDAVYLDRHDASKRTSPDATLDDYVQLQSSGTTLDTIFNRQNVTRIGGAEQSYQDTTSFRSYGDLPGSDISTAYLSNDTQALGLASYLVTLQKDPASPLWQLTIAPSSTAALNVCLGFELGDYVSVGGTGFTLEQLQAQANPAGMTFQLLLSERGVDSEAFIVGASSVGDSSRFITY